MINVIYRFSVENLLRVKRYVEIKEKENHIPPLRYINGIFVYFLLVSFLCFERNKYKDIYILNHPIIKKVKNLP